MAYELFPSVINYLASIFSFLLMILFCFPWFLTIHTLWKVPGYLVAPWGLACSSTKADHPLNTSLLFRSPDSKYNPNT